jgi:Uma2 family endonuclease
MALQVKTPSVKNKSPFTKQTPIVYYPDSDGQPMAENDPQYYCITDTHFALAQRYLDNPNVYVSADLLIYYVAGDPGKSVAPDILVSFDVPKGDRRSYFIWLEGKPPDVVFEVASASTWEADLSWKRGLYQGLGIQEYFIVDPMGQYLDSPLLGYRLENEVYRPLSPLSGEQGTMGLESQVLGLELWLKPNPAAGSPSTDDKTLAGRISPAPYILRMYDLETETWLLAPDEVELARREAEEELARLRQELAQLRGQAE